MRKINFPQSTSVSWVIVMPETAQLQVAFKSRAKTGESTAPADRVYTYSPDAEDFQFCVDMIAKYESEGRTHGIVAQLLPSLGKFQKLDSVAAM